LTCPASTPSASTPSASTPRRSRPSRSNGGQRRYTRNEITVVQYVVRLIDEGMTLPAIRRVLLLEAGIKDLKARIRQLEADRSQLRVTLAERDALPAALRQPGPAVSAVVTSGDQRQG
jgi:DNA-binding transcriptional MerR regulator